MPLYVSGVFSRHGCLINASKRNQDNNQAKQPWNFVLVPERDEMSM
jgi:hypothetical protein